MTNRDKRLKGWFVWIKDHGYPIGRVYACDPDYVCHMYERKHGERVTMVRAAPFAGFDFFEYEREVYRTDDN